MEKINIAILLITLITAFSNAQDFGEERTFSAFKKMTSAEKQICIYQFKEESELNSYVNVNFNETDSHYVDIDFWYESGVGLKLSENGYHDTYNSIGLFYDKKYLVTARYVSYGSGTIQEAGALYHLKLTERFYSTSAGAGVSAVWGDSENQNFTTVGLPLEIKFWFTPIQFFGLGFSCIGNLNAKKTLSDFNISIIIGKLY